MIQTTEVWIILFGWVLLACFVFLIHFFHKKKCEEQERRDDEEIEAFLEYIRQRSAPLKSSGCSCREHKKTNKLKIVP